MDIKLSKFKEQNLQPKKYVSTPNFTGAIKFKNMPVKKDALLLAGTATTALTSAAVLKKEEAEKSEKKLSLNKFFLQNIFKMDAFSKVATMDALRKTPKENREAALSVLNNIQNKYKEHDIDYTYRYYVIEEFVPHINDKNKDLFNEIISEDIKTYKEEKSTRFQKYKILDMLEQPSKTNIEKFKILANLKNDSGKYIFDAYSIDTVLKNKKIKPQYLKEIVKSDHAKSLSSYAITDIARAVNPQNKSVLPILLNTEDNSLKMRKDKYRVNNSYAISSILSVINNDNKDIVGTLLNYTDEYGGYKFEPYEIGEILKVTNSENKDSVKKLFEDDDNKILTKTLSTCAYTDIISRLNKNNSEILSLILDEYKNSLNGGKTLIYSSSDISYLLDNVTNDEKEIFASCLKMEDRVHPGTYYFENHQVDELPELIGVLSNPITSDIAKNLIDAKEDGTLFARFSSIAGINDLCHIIHENDKTKMENLNYVLDMYDDYLPRFRKMNDVVNITNILSDNDKKDNMLEILKMMVDGEYRFSDFSNKHLTNKITSAFDIEKVRLLANVKEANRDAYPLTIEEVLNITNKFKDYNVEQLPVSDVIPENVYLDNVMNILYKYQNEDLNLNSLNLKDKIMLDKYANSLDNLPLERKEKFFVNVSALKKDIEKSISQTITPVKITNEAKVNLFRNVLANNSEVENVIKNADFTQYGKKGLPLKYTRIEFLNDLNEILNSVDAETSKSILQRLQIEQNSDKTGYEGVLSFQDLNKESETDKKIYDICEKFILKNEVQTGDEKFDKMANSLIKGYPEFVNIIGKQPHGAHNYSIDIHILEVLKNCLNHPDYNDLSSLDKTKLKMAVLLHDIAKKEGVVDKNHQNTSALYTRNILEKYALSQSIKDDIYLLVKNHHWLEDLNTNAMTIEALSCNFKNSDDFKLSKIFAYSDLKGVSAGIFDTFAHLLDEEQVKKLEKQIEENKQTGNPLYTSRVVYRDRIPKQVLNDKTYRVFDFNSYSDDKDLSEVGFADGTKKKDLRFLLHTVSNVENLNTVETISDVAHNSILSESFISVDNASSYYNGGMGVILETDIPNIVNAYYENQGSGYAKTQENLVELRTSRWRVYYREYVPLEIQKILNITPEQYAKLFDKISHKKYLTQISDAEEFDLNGKTVNGKDVKEALKKAQDTILSKNSSHNEVVASNSKVVGLSAKENSLESISPEYLKFAQHYNLPIYLLGK